MKWKPRFYEEFPWDRSGPQPEKIHPVATRKALGTNSEHSRGYSSARTLEEAFLAETWPARDRTMSKTAGPCDPERCRGGLVALASVGPLGELGTAGRSHRHFTLHALPLQRGDPGTDSGVHRVELIRALVVGQCLAQVPRLFA